MAVKRIGISGVNVRKMKALTIKMETVTLSDKGRYHMICSVYELYNINIKIFFRRRRFIFEGLS